MLGDGIAEPNSDRLGNRRIHAGEDSYAAANFFDGDGKFGMRQMKCFGTLATGIPFRAFQSPSQFQIHKAHVILLLPACSAHRFIVKLARFVLNVSKDA